jgi:hypothetical protein
VLRWHKRTSWRRRGAKLGAIDLGAELKFVQKAGLAQLAKHKVLNFMVMGSSPTVGVFLILFVFVTYFFFVVQIFCFNESLLVQTNFIHEAFIPSVSFTEPYCPPDSTMYNMITMLNLHMLLNFYS